MGKELISIIVPIYNAEVYLPRCIESILQQTYTNFELLLIDDGSTDCSGKICDEYCKLDKRCKVIHQDNSGVSGARNTGLRSALGEYITFIDNDDNVHPLYLEHLHRAINDGNFQISMCLFEYCLVQKEKYELVDSKYSIEIISQDILIQGTFYKIVRFENNVGIPISVVWGKLYRKEIMKGTYFKHIIGEDLEYNSRLFLQVKNVALVQICLYYWINRPNSLSHNFKISKYYNPCGEIDTRYKILENIPEIYRKYRGYALISLYKSLLSTKYNIHHYSSGRKENINAVIDYAKTIERKWGGYKTGDLFLDIFICILRLNIHCPSLYFFLRRIKNFAWTICVCLLKM